MTKKAMTVAELKNILNRLSDDCTVKLSIHYDNCEHMQNLNDFYVFNNWLILSGGNKE